MTANNNVVPIDNALPVPAGLGYAGSELWTRVTRAYSFEFADEKLILLEQAGKTADLVDRLQRVVDTSDDLRVRGSQGQPVSMPELPELRQYRAQLASLMKQIGCDTAEDTPTAVGPKMTRSESGRHAARVRWSRAGGGA